LVPGATIPPLMVFALVAVVFSYAAIDLIV
jgi:hypothetical protein